jgi:hypothetical protein
MRGSSALSMSWAPRRHGGRQRISAAAASTPSMFAPSILAWTAFMKVASGSTPTSLWCWTRWAASAPASCPICCGCANSPASSWFSWATISRPKPSRLAFHCAGNGPGSVVGGQFRCAEFSKHRCLGNSVPLAYYISTSRPTSTTCAVGPTTATLPILNGPVAQLLLWSSRSGCR